jgi:cyclophilin family peptidyl-prolyl cis-trans isomerase
VGTQKRERQKANRLQRQIEQARTERVGAVKRNVLRWGLGLIAAIGGVVLIAWLGGAFDGNEAAPVTTTDEFASTTTAGTQPAVPKPAVSIPAELPTELVTTTLTEGTGEAAAVGDTVLVRYVGVRSVDGTEFDNNFDSGGTFPVVLGAGSVIAGWDQGLVGTQAGGRYQLDIPADLAYGDNPRGDIIQPGDALTFVVDVVAVEKRVPVTAPPQADASECPATDGSEAQQREFTEYPPFCIDVTKTYTAEIVTNFGTITAELFPDKAPLAVNSFVTLARFHYFDGTECHRAMPGFVVQCGDPTATGSGGPGYSFPDELPLPGEYQIGSLAMANSGVDTNGSQFFIVSGPSGAALPPQYSLFGQVTEGLDTTVAAMDEVANPESNGVPPLEQILIESVTVTES